MQKVYNERGFDEEVIRCGRCGWEGSGYDANIIDLYGLSRVKEVHCGIQTGLKGKQKPDSTLTP